jgi:hypothetical protein
MRSMLLIEFGQRIVEKQDRPVVGDAVDHGDFGEFGSYHGQALHAA